MNEPARIPLAELLARSRLVSAASERLTGAPRLAKLLTSQIGDPLTCPEFHEALRTVVSETRQFLKAARTLCTEGADDSWRAVIPAVSLEQKRKSFVCCAYGARSVLSQSAKNVLAVPSVQADSLPTSVVTENGPVSAPTTKRKKRVTRDPEAVRKKKRRQRYGPKRAELDDLLQSIELIGTQCASLSSPYTIAGHRLHKLEALCVGIEDWELWARKTFPPISDHTAPESVSSATGEAADMAVRAAPLAQTIVTHEKQSQLPEELCPLEPTDLITQLRAAKLLECSEKTISRRIKDGILKQYSKGRVSHRDVVEIKGFALLRAPRGTKKAK